MSDMYVPGQSPATGNRFDYQLYPQGRKGGLLYRPLSGVSEGFVPSAVSVGSGAVTITFSAGVALLDGTEVKTTTAASALVLPTTVDFTAPVDQTIYVYLNPQRVVPALITGTPASPADKDLYVKVAAIEDYQIVSEFYQYNLASTSWKVYKAVKSAVGYGHNNLPLNGIKPVIDLTTTNNKNFSTVAEPIVYHKTGYPPYVNSPANAYLRQSAAIQLAKVVVNNSAVVSFSGYGLESQITP